MKPGLLCGLIGAMLWLAPVEATPAASSTPEAPATQAATLDRTAFRRFQADWQAGNHDAADAYARSRLAPGVPPKGLPAVIDYLVFERGQCDLDARDSRMAKVLEHEWQTKAGLLVCAAARSIDDESASNAALAELMALGRWSGRIHVYDAFARQPTINQAALRWLRRYDRFDPIPTWGWRGDDALTEQIRAGRVDNVRILLASGYQANHAILDPRDVRQSDARPKPARRGPLPLAVAREALSRHGQAAIEIARLLLDAGADPYKLAWYPAPLKPGVPPAPPELLAVFDSVIEQAKPGHSPLGLEFVGFRMESSPTGLEMYARFLVGNGGSGTRRFKAWRADGLWLFNGLAASTDMETQPPGGRDWWPPVRIEDGISPSTTVELAEGQSVEVLYQWSPHAFLTSEPGTRYRLRLTHDAGNSYSDPFQPQFPQEDVEYDSLKAERDWFGLGPGARRG